MTKQGNQLFSLPIQILFFLSCTLIPFQSFAQGGPSGGGTGPGPASERTTDYLNRSVTHTYIGSGVIDIEIERSFICSNQDQSCVNNHLWHMKKTIEKRCAKEGGQLLDLESKKIGELESVSQSDSKLVSMATLGSCVGTGLSKNLKKKDTGKTLKYKYFGIFVAKNRTSTVTQSNLHLCQSSDKKICKAKAAKALKNRASFACKQANPNLLSEERRRSINVLYKKYNRFEVFASSTSDCYDPQN